MTPETARPAKTGVGRAQDPAAGVAPVRRRGARRTPVPGSAGAGTSQPPRCEVPAQTSPQPSERQAAGSLNPATGADGLPSSAPGRERAQSPAGASLKAHGSPPAGSTGRTYTITLPAGLKLLSLNDRGHWAARYRRSQALKKAAWAMALQARIPRLERVSVAAEYQPPDRRRRDADNPVASVKAAIDGIVAAGCLVGDDSPRYVESVTCRIGETYPKGRLVLHLTEIAATGSDVA